MGGWLLRSTDGGHSWSRPIVPPSLPYDTSKEVFGTSCPMFNRGAMLERKDGTLLWAVVRHDDAPKRTSVHLARSNDKGNTWQYVTPIATDPQIIFNETSLVELASGTIAAFVRTGKMGGRGVLALSNDGGKSFGPWKDLGFVGEPYQAIRLKDDRILVVYGYRQKPTGVRARVMAADLSDALTAPEFIIREDGGAIDLGYPWALQLPDGNVFVAYYLNIADGPRHIAASLLSIK